MEAESKVRAHYLAVLAKAERASAAYKADKRPKRKEQKDDEQTRQALIRGARRILAGLDVPPAERDEYAAFYIAQKARDYQTA